MKKTYTVLSFLGILLFSGCIKEDRSDCPEPQQENLIIRFEYNDREGRSIIEDNIESIDLVLFDEQLRYYGWIATSIDRLGPDHTLRLEMDEGNYYAVAWGNVSDRDQMNGLNGYTIPTAALTHNNTASTDPLFYAPDLRTAETRAELDRQLFEVSVTPKQVSEYTMPFMGAHHRVEVFLRGFPEINNTSLPMPQVTVDNLPASYDFLLNPALNTIRLSRTAEHYTTPENERLGTAVILVPHFKLEDNITINIEGTTATNPYDLRVEMREIIEELEIDVSDGENQTIRVVLTFDGIGVTVSVPNWKVNNVGGGIAG